MELRHLRSFVTVAEEVSFTAAARRLRVAQPALSQQIHLLEDEIGILLFSRAKRPLQLTAAGETLLINARQILKDAVGAIDTASRAARGEIGRLSIGFMGTAASPILTKLIREYRKLHPEVTLDLHDMSPANQREALARGRIHLGFSRRFDDPSHIFEFRHVFQDRYVVALPEDHPLAGKKTIRLAQLKRENFILFKRPDSPFLFDHIIASCTAAKFSPRIVETPAQMPSVLFWVEAGIGVSIVPGSLANLKRRSIVYLPLAEKIKPSPLVLVWPKKQDCPTRAGFVELLEKYKSWIQKEAESF